MIRRCYDASMASFDRYGGRGIQVCSRWHQFENFFADMGSRLKGMTLIALTTIFITCRRIADG
jgi:hypothetical protein